VLTLAGSDSPAHWTGQQLCKAVYAIAKHCKMNNNHLKGPCCKDWRFKVGDGTLRLKNS
jgi:hypothetical protein